MPELKPRRIPHPIWFGVAAVVMVLAVWVFFGSNIFSESYWVGHKSLHLEFQILDAKTRQPIENASVVIFNTVESPQPGHQFGPHPNDPVSMEVKSDSAGRAFVTNKFTTAGLKNIFEETGNLFFHFWWVHVRANGYEDSAFELSERFGDGRKAEDSSPLSMTVALEKRDR